jgi:uncharacterized membrane protein YfcA
VFGLNINLTQAAPIVLLAVMSAASVGEIQGLNKGIMCYKTALLMAASGIAFAPLGAWLAGCGWWLFIVPSLRKMSNFDTQSIIATSLAVIALVSAAASLLICCMAILAGTLLCHLLSALR